MFNILLVGSKKSGKSAIFSKVVTPGQELDFQFYQPTTEMVPGGKAVTVKNKNNVDVNANILLWDTFPDDLTNADQEFYNQINRIVFVVDTSSESALNDSLNELDKLIKDVKTQYDQLPPFVIMGSKKDLIKYNSNNDIYNENVARENLEKFAKEKLGVTDKEVKDTVKLISAKDDQQRNTKEIESTIIDLAMRGQHNVVENVSVTKEKLDDNLCSILELQSITHAIILARTTPQLSSLINPLKDLKSELQKIYNQRQTTLKDVFHEDIANVSKTSLALMETLGKNVENYDLKATQASVDALVKFNQSITNNFSPDCKFLLKAAAVVTLSALLIVAVGFSCGAASPLIGLGLTAAVSFKAGIIAGLALTGAANTAAFFNATRDFRQVRHASDQVADQVENILPTLKPPSSS